MLDAFKSLFRAQALLFWRTVSKKPALRKSILRIIQPVLPFLRKMVFGAHWIDYKDWISTVEANLRIDAKAAREHIVQLNHRPLMSIIMPCYETSPAHLRAAIESIRGQFYENWELCIVDDASPSDSVISTIASFLAADPRIRAERRQKNGHISAASNTALAMAKGEWIILMDHDDLLNEAALFEIAVEINKHPSTQIIYTDEDQIDDKNTRQNPFFKPDFDPYLLLGQNFVNHLGAYKRDLVALVGGFREGFEGSQDHDLILRASAACPPGSIRHIPSILYHWRRQASEASFSEKSLERCLLAARHAVTEHLHQRGIVASVSPAPLAPIWIRAHFPVPNPAPKVSIIIPTRDRASLLDACISGILHRTDYQNFEILIADNGSTEEETRRLFSKLERIDNIKILSLPGPFNYSWLNNQAAAKANGEILLLLNNDVDVIAPDWLTELVSLAIRPDVGAVGPKLLYEDKTIQHAGLVLGIEWPGGVAAHYGLRANRGDAGPFGSLALLRTVSAVTGACLAVRRELYQAVGGLDEVSLAVAFNDVDFCLRLQERGYRNLWTPFAELYHLESISRGDDLSGEKLIRFQKEKAIMRQRWGRVLDSDPYWNPNLSLNSFGRIIARHSRRPKEWWRLCELRET
jgi:GT2 family glycosyltransferase